MRCVLLKFRYLGSFFSLVKIYGYAYSHYQKALTPLGLALKPQKARFYVQLN